MGYRYIAKEKINSNTKKDIARDSDSEISNAPTPRFPIILTIYSKYFSWIFTILKKKYDS